MVQVPLNNWLPYLAQLQTSLQRGEAPVVKALLSQLATAFPQAVYYGLRTILLSLREVCTSAVILASVMYGSQSARAGVAVPGLQRSSLSIIWRTCDVHLSAVRERACNFGCQPSSERSSSADLW